MASDGEAEETYELKYWDTISSDEELQNDPSCRTAPENQRSSIADSSSDEEKLTVKLSFLPKKTGKRSLASLDEEHQDVPSHSTASTSRRSEPGSIQPERKRLKMSKCKYEFTLYRETWHAIKAPKDFFRDTTSIASLMLFTRSNLNTDVPLGCDSELAFLVDTTRLEFDKDLTCDETGKYKRPSYARSELVVDDEQNIFKFKECSTAGTQRYTLLRRYYPHRDTPGFFRTIYELQQEGVRSCPTVLIRYEWRGEKTSLRMTPHGNCKSSKTPFIRTRKALTQKLKRPSGQSVQGMLNEKTEEGRRQSVCEFECTLYHEKWHAIKAPKALFKDSKRIASLLLFNPSIVNTTLPVGCDSELAFLVDTTRLEFDKGLTCDETGKYKRPSYARSELVVDEKNFFGFKECSTAGTQRYTLLRRYYPHRDIPGFFRTIYELQQDGVRSCPTVLISYKWREEKTPLRLTAHGNCKSSKMPFIRTKNALTEKLKMPPRQSAQGMLNKKTEEGERRRQNVCDFESTLYREKWHAIKAPKALFKDSKRIASLMLFKPSNVNTTVPVGCDSELAFLVDTTRLEFDEDLTCDETGKYKRPSYARSELVVDDEKNFFGFRECPVADTQRYTLLRRYYPHRDTPGFFRTIYELQQEGVRSCPTVLIRYEWRGEKTCLRLTAHGNSKSSKTPFIRTKKAVIEKLKKPSRQSAQGTLNETFEEEGGSIGIDGFASVPRNRQQIYRHRAGRKKTFIKSIETSSTGDFVRNAELTNNTSKGPHPRCVVYTNKQIEDMRRNCAAGSILSFDGTLDCGPLFVTAASYRHQEFVNRGNGKNVLMPGPILVHARKDVETYQYFGNQISKAMGNEQVPFFRTGGETAVYTGLKDSPSFSKSTHLLCMIHHHRNVENKLEKLGVHRNTANILRSIYGGQVNETHYEGLVDSKTNEEYEQALRHWSAKWDCLEREETGKQPEFATWFRQYKSEEVKECMLKPLRQQAGLRDSPRQFSNKDCKSMSSMISKWIGKKKFGNGSWNDLVDGLEKFVKSKYTELEMALIGLGERRPVNEHLQKTPLEWAHMKAEERKVTLESANLGAPEDTAKELSIPPEDSGISGFTPYELQDAWTKAGRIIECSRSIVDFPSVSSQYICFEGEDHFKVTCQNYVFTCDKQCKSFILYDRLFCQHTLAVAEQKGKLADFLWRINAKKQS